MNYFNRYIKYDNPTERRVSCRLVNVHYSAFNGSLFVFVEVEYGYLYVSHVDGSIVVDVCVRFPVG